jgi:hypothetical protein
VSGTLLTLPEIHSSQHQPSAQRNEWTLIAVVVTSPAICTRKCSVKIRVGQKEGPEVAP